VKSRAGSLSGFTSIYANFCLAALDAVWPVRLMLKFVCKTGLRKFNFRRAAGTAIKCA
jgi:hypothetical protein